MLRIRSYLIRLPLSLSVRPQQGNSRDDEPAQFGLCIGWQGGDRVRILGRMSNPLPPGCDLLALRDYARSFVEYASRVQPDGSRYYMPQAAVAAIHAFIREPTVGAGRTLLAEVPSFRFAALKCSPAGQAIWRIQEAVMRSALTAAHCLDPLLLADDTTDQANRRFLTQCEFVYFFVHLVERVSAIHADIDAHAAIMNELTTDGLAAFVLSVAGDWPAQQRDGVIRDVSVRLNDARREYSDNRCDLPGFVSPGKLGRRDLLEQFCENVSSLLGYDDDPTVSARCKEVTLASWNEASLPDLVKKTASFFPPAA